MVGCQYFLDIPGAILGIPRKRGISKAKMFQQKLNYETKLEFPEEKEEGGKETQKKPSMEGEWIYILEQHNSKKFMATEGKPSVFTVATLICFPPQSPCYIFLNFSSVRGFKRLDG